MILRIFLLLFYLIGAPFFISLSYFLIENHGTLLISFSGSDAPSPSFLYLFYLLYNGAPWHCLSFFHHLYLFFLWFFIFSSLSLFYLLYDGAPWHGWGPVSLFLITFIVFLPPVGTPSYKTRRTLQQMRHNFSSCWNCILSEAHSSRNIFSRQIVLATLVALHFTPISEWVDRSFGLA